MSLRIRFFSLIAILGVGAGACGGPATASPGAPGNGSSPGAVVSTPGGSADAVARFGAVPDPAAVTWQPDVVFLPNPAAAIRSVAANGITWYLDRRAEGIERVQVGTVMYATSLAVGRVVDIREEGADLLAVTLAPVGLGEVIKDGQIRISQPLDLAGLTMRSIPGTPGIVAPVEPLAPPEAPATGDARVDRPIGPERPFTLSPRPPSADSIADLDLLPTMPPPYNQGSTDWSAGDWSGTVAREGGDVLFTVEQHGDLQWNGKVVFHFTTPHLDADLGIVDGEVGDGEIELRGLRQVAIGLQAGAYNGLSDNVNEKVELPVSLDQPVIVGGVAMNLNVTFKFLIQTAFTAKNSTIAAVGAWDTEGPLSYDRTTGTVDVGWPKITANPNILDSLKSISVGTNGVVFATSIRVMLGLGIPQVNAGPYVRLVTSVALATGSSIGFAGEALKCRQASVTINGAFGAGLTMSDGVAAGINAYIRLLGEQFSVQADTEPDLLAETLYSNAFWMPDTDYCKLTS